MTRTRTNWLGGVVAFLAVLAACSSSGGSGGTGGTAASGGIAGSGGAVGSGGTVGSGGAAGGGGSGALTLEQFGAKFRLGPNDLSGWREATDAETETGEGMGLYTKANLTTRIDGPADNYVAHGCSYAMFEQVKGPDPRTASLVVMEFGTATNAASMVAYQKDVYSGTFAIPGYDSSVGFVYPLLTGVSVFASDKALYLELTMDGYGSDQNAAAADAAALLEVYTAKNK